MISIEGEMRDLLNSALDDGCYSYVGTASRDGRPQISMRGSLSVYDSETLALPRHSHALRVGRSARQGYGADAAA